MIHEKLNVFFISIEIEKDQKQLHQSSCSYVERFFQGRDQVLDDQKTDKLMNFGLLTFSRSFFHEKVFLEMSNQK